MLYFLTPLIIGFILLAVFLFFRVKEQRMIALIFKGCASLLFIITALVAWLTSKNPNNYEYKSTMESGSDAYGRQPSDAARKRRRPQRSDYRHLHRVGAGVSAWRFYRL